MDFPREFPRWKTIANLQVEFRTGRITNPKKASDSNRTSPLRMQPCEDTDGANFERPGWHDPHVPKIVVVDGRDVNHPDGSTRGDEATKAFFGTNAEKVSLARRLRC